MPDVLSATALSAIELRRYTLHPGRRDALIELFEREFVEAQERCGIRVVGTFRDIDAPDRFVWLRGFADLGMRAGALADFYGGPAWQRHRDAANATMVDSDDVFLLRPATARGVFADLPPRAAFCTLLQVPPAPWTLTLCPLREPADAGLLAHWETCVRPGWRAAGADPVACLVSEGARNDFPRLPVREGEPVIAWLTRFPDAAAQARHAADSDAILRSPAWRDRLAGAAVTSRLVPTLRSALR